MTKTCYAPCRACAATKVTRTVAPRGKKKERVIINCASCGQQRADYTRKRNND